MAVVCSLYLEDGHKLVFKLVGIVNNHLVQVPVDIIYCILVILAYLP